ncbi:MAG: SRPBCC family protein [Pseudomonadota bacterium]
MRRVLIGIVIILIVAIGLGFVLPDRVEVEREVVIDAPPAQVYALIADFNQWERWSPWAERDPEAQYTITGEGVGHRMEWVSDDPQLGNGSQEITALTPDSRVESALSFGDMGQGRATFELSPEGTGTRVVWSFATNMRDGTATMMQPVATYLGFFMDGMLGGDYETGLANLKTTAEAS